MNRIRYKKHTEDYIFSIVIAVVMTFVFILCVYPFYLAIILSFNDGSDAARGGIYIWPRMFTTANYTSFFTDETWVRGFFVTALRTVLGTVLTTFFTTFVSYGLSFPNLVFRKFYIGVVIFCMYFNGGLIPYYMVLREVHLLNTFWVYLIPQALNLFYVLISINFFQAIPNSLYESAKLDGAGEMTILAKIALPLSKPLLATIAIFTSVAHWSSWYDSAFFVQNNKLRTLGYLLMEVINKSNTNSISQYASSLASTRITPLSVQVTAMVISVLPILCIYPFMQKYFISGMTLGSVKE